MPARFRRCLRWAHRRSWPDYHSLGFEARLADAGALLAAVLDDDVAVGASPRTPMATWAPALQRRQAMTVAAPASAPLVTILVRTAFGVLAVPLAAGGLVIIGRDHDSDVVIADPSIANHHACIALRRGSRPTIVDLGSKSGTWVEEIRLVPGQARSIGYGEWFRFGEVMCQLDRRRASRRE